MAKSDQSGGPKPVTTHMVIGDQLTVSHLKGPLGISGKLDKQMSVGHLAQPIGAKPGGTPQSGPAPKPAASNQGSQGGGKK
jgi:hypothetical protein